MKFLLEQARACTVCEDKLPHGPRPVLSMHKQSKVIIVGQAPGRVVHASGIPWDDKSGDRLRDWLGVTKEQFYNERDFGILPMGFCYPGTGKTGDLPPCKECAPLWHDKLLTEVKGKPLILLIGKYAQDYYLPKYKKVNLTNKVMNFTDYLPNYFVLPHPSPRNNIWRKKNPWFEEEIIPFLKVEVRKKGLELEGN